MQSFLSFSIPTSHPPPILLQSSLSTRTCTIYYTLVLVILTNTDVPSCFHGILIYMARSHCTSVSPRLRRTVCWLSSLGWNACLTSENVARVPGQATRRIMARGQRCPARARSPGLARWVAGTAASWRSWRGRGTRCFRLRGGGSRERKLSQAGNGSTTVINRPARSGALAQSEARQVLAGGGLVLDDVGTFRESGGSGNNRAGSGDDERSGRPFNRPDVFVWRKS